MAYNIQNIKAFADKRCQRVQYIPHNREPKQTDEHTSLLFITIIMHTANTLNIKEVYE